MSSSDHRLSDLKMMRSHSLPLCLDYSNPLVNPILWCIADQTKHDNEWRFRSFSAEKLLNEIFRALNCGQITWPQTLPITELFSCQEWINRMKNLPTTYTEFR